jgi:hypothetical protein
MSNRTKSRSKRSSAREAPKNNGRFNRALETVEKLSLEDQAALIALLEKRKIARRRAELAKEIAQANREYKIGLVKPRTPESIMREIMS